MVPWLHEEVSRTRAVLGADYWPYGVEPNTVALETFLRYAREQGLADGPLSPADLFAPETLDEYIV
jgi:4,5-dihydroxyphthalate decarboxylase